MTAARPVLRALARDPHFHLVIVGGILTGVLLWWWLPAGFAQPIAADPMRLIGFLLFYPLLEEWLFRGVLQGILLQRPWGQQRRAGISVANLLTSLAFVLLHFINHPPLWAASVIVPSLALGYFRDRHDSLVPPLLLHPFFNLVYLLAGLAGA